MEPIRLAAFAAFQFVAGVILSGFSGGGIAGFVAGLVTAFIAVGVGGIVVMEWRRV